MRRPGWRWALGAVAAATVGALAGCSSTHLLGHRTTTATVTALESAAPATTTSTAASVTTLVTTTVNGTTTTVDEPGRGKPAILLGDMNTPEQFILGALYQAALEAQGYQVELSRNIGPTSVSQAAVTEGNLDIYPEYLNTYDSQVAGDSTRFKNLGEAYRAAERWARDHDQRLLAPTPFSDTAGIAVLSTYARAHRLRTLADLRRVQDTLTLGSPFEFSTEPGGLAALEQAYGFLPALTTTINIGNQYGGLRTGTIQATYVETTDWQLIGPLFQTLADSQHVLGFGNVVPVVSSKALEQEGPAFPRTIDRVDRLLTQSAIRGLASEMRDSTDPAMSAADVASEFLQGYGIVAPPPWSVLTTTTTTTTSSTTPTTPAPGSTSTGSG